MSNSEIIAKGVAGVTGSLIAVTIPYAEFIQWVIQVIGGLLGITVAIITLYNLIKKKKMNKESILGIIRHMLTFGGGFMTQNGMATDDQVTTAVSAAVTLIGVIWSILSKKK